MSPRDPQDRAKLLLRKSAADLTLVEKLVDSGVPYEAIGFHAQQACEKALKAVLTGRGLAYPRTHNLGLLIDLVRAAAIEVPDAVELAVELTPFAVFYRYDEYDLDEEPIALDALRDVVSEVHRWARHTCRRDT